MQGRYYRRDEEVLEILAPFQGVMNPLRTSRCTTFTSHLTHQSARDGDARGKGDSATSHHLSYQRFHGQTTHLPIQCHLNVSYPKGSKIHHNSHAIGLYTSLPSHDHSRIDSNFLYEGMPSICEAPSTGATHAILSFVNSSPLGLFWFAHSGSSRIPALMITAPGKLSPVRKSVVPQSGQK